LSKYIIKYFNVRLSDPEDLANEFEQYEGNRKKISVYQTKALFHEGHLIGTFKECNLSYGKSRQKKYTKYFTLTNY
jgi:hypothetical protein